MNDMGPRPPKTESVLPRLNGVVDVLRPNRIAGWAIDRSDVTAAVTVDIFREGRLHKTVVADRYRPDLEKGGIGTGRYGFGVDIDPPVDPGLEFTVIAKARLANGQSTTLKTASPAEQVVSPELRMLHRVLELAEEIRSDQRETARMQDAAARTAQQLEVTQARLDAVMAALEAAPKPQTGSGLPRIVVAAVLLGLVSLGVGIGSLWFD